MSKRPHGAVMVRVTFHKVPGDAHLTGCALDNGNIYSNQTTVLSHMCCNAVFVFYIYAEGTDYTLTQWNPYCWGYFTGIRYISLCWSLTKRSSQKRSNSSMWQSTGNERRSPKHGKSITEIKTPMADTVNFGQALPIHICVIRMNTKLSSSYGLSNTHTCTCKLLLPCRNEHDPYDMYKMLAVNWGVFSI